MRQALMMPLGEGDFKKGIRVNFLRTVQPMLEEIGCGVGVELKGNEIDPDGWVKDFVAELPEAQICWHPSAGIAKTLGNPEQPIPPALEKACCQAGELKNRYGLTVFTIHLAPAMAVEPSVDAGMERYNSPIGAEKMLIHIERQIDPLCRLAELSGETLAIETVDTCNFVDSGYKLPTYLALQTGAGKELKYIAYEVRRRSGHHLMITVDPEHVICSQNVFQHRRDQRDLTSCDPYEPTPAQLKLAEIAGYWLVEKCAPTSAELKFGSAEEDVRQALENFNPELLHLGAAIEAETEIHEIGTHLPYNPWDNKQMELLDYLLEWSHGKKDLCYGWVIEVAGRRVSERYSRWSPRPDNDEVAKMSSFLVVLDHLRSHKMG